MRVLFIILRVLVAAAIVAAVVGQILLSLEFWRDSGVTNTASNVVNFFSFFTVESNIAAAAVLLIGAGLAIAGRTTDPAWFAVTRASVATYMVVTGIVYNLLLRGIELPQGSTLGWSNEVLHVVVPVYLLLDWILAPGRIPLGAKRIWPILVFPIVWVVYTLVRGPFVVDQVYGNDFWYPYPFLNPNASANGYLSVAFYVVPISAVIGLVAAGLLWISRRRAPAD
jgi:hypothetical protein